MLCVRTCMMCTYMHMVGTNLLNYKFNTLLVHRYLLTLDRSLLTERLNYKFNTLHASDIETMGMSISFLFPCVPSGGKARRAGLRNWRE